MKYPYQLDVCFVDKFIVCTKKRRGKGTPEDPVRVITEIFTTDGELVAEHDPKYEN